MTDASSISFVLAFVEEGFMQVSLGSGHKVSAIWGWAILLKFTT